MNTSEHEWTQANTGDQWYTLVNTGKRRERKWTIVNTGEWSQESNSFLNRRTSSTSSGHEVTKKLCQHTQHKWTLVNTGEHLWTLVITGERGERKWTLVNTGEHRWTLKWALVNTCEHLWTMARESDSFLNRRTSLTSRGHEVAKKLCQHLFLMVGQLQRLKREQTWHWWTKVNTGEDKTMCSLMNSECSLSKLWACRWTQENKSEHRWARVSSSNLHFTHGTPYKWLTSIHPCSLVFTFAHFCSLLLTFEKSEHRWAKVNVFWRPK